MHRILEDLLCIHHLHNVAQIHDCNNISYMLYNRNVMGDEDISQPQLFLEPFEQVDDLGLDAD